MVTYANSTILDIEGHSNVYTSRHSYVRLTEDLNALFQRIFILDSIERIGPIEKRDFWSCKFYMKILFRSRSTRIETNLLLSSWGLGPQVIIRMIQIFKKSSLEWENYIFFLAEKSNYSVREAEQTLSRFFYYNKWICLEYHLCRLIRQNYNLLDYTSLDWDLYK